MARSQSNTVIKVLGAGIAVVAGGAAFGYLFGSVRDTHPTVQPAQPPVSTTLPQRPAITPSSIHPHTANGNYTAPGAPQITIQEESQPILRRVLTPPTPRADTEASQEATPVITKPAATDAAKNSASTHSATGQTPDTTPTPPKTDSDSGSAPAAPAPPTPPPAPADPDFERVNTPKPAAPSTDPESGQQGGSTGTKATTDANTNKVQFRVQTGAYTDESNARSVADTLRGEGYSTSTRSERDGDHLVYKVQVGAYHSKVGANKAAGDLQKKGYPAFISPVGP